MSLFKVGDKVFVFPIGLKGTVVEISSYKGEIYDVDEEEYFYLDTVFDYRIEYDTEYTISNGETTNSFKSGWWEEHDLKKFDKRKSGFGKFIKKLEL